MFSLAPDSDQNPFRRRRVAELNATIASVVAEKGSCRVIDIGGTRDFWFTWRNQIMSEGVSVDCVNTDESHGSSSGYDRVKFVKGDGRDLAWAADRSFDIAFCNSVIEHAGLWADMLLMAGEVRRVAVRYIVQTPYYWFPIEPHLRAPLVHWLPEPIGYRIAMACKLGFFDRQATVSGAMQVVQDSRLLDIGQMKALFPDATIRKERFMGLVKSVIAVRGGSSPP